MDGTDVALRAKDTRNENATNGCGLDLPICWQKSEEVFNQDMEKIDALLEPSAEKAELAGNLALG